MALDVRDLDQKTRLPLRRIRVVNVYDQFIGRKYIYLKAYTRRRRAIKDVNQDKIIIERIIFISDFHIYSSKQNLICENSIKAKALEALLTKFNLIIVNEEGVLTRKSSEKISIINLVVTSPGMGDIIT